MKSPDLGLFSNFQSSIDDVKWRRHIMITQNSLTQKNLSFEYSGLNDETRTKVQQYTNVIKGLMRRTSEDIIDIGQKLIEVKQYLGHGNFLKWLKSEFNWSVSTATKFMQVGEQFKFVNFTNLNITASALYLIAAPSTPKEAREEVLQQATLGENINYSKAKTIIHKYKKKAKLSADMMVAVNSFEKSTEENYCTSITPVSDKTSACHELEELTKQKAETEKDSLACVTCIGTPITTTIQGTSDAKTEKFTNIVNQTTVECELKSPEFIELAVRMKELTPQQLALVIANSGLSADHLKAIITTSEKVLTSSCLTETIQNSIFNTQD